MHIRECAFFPIVAGAAVQAGTIRRAALGSGAPTRSSEPAPRKAAFLSLPA
jgi:hypothetical protein